MPLDRRGNSVLILWITSECYPFQRLSRRLIILHSTGVVDFLGCMWNWSAVVQLEIGHVSLVGRLEESNNIGTLAHSTAPCSRDQRDEERTEVRLLKLYY